MSETTINSQTIHFHGFYYLRAGESLKFTLHHLANLTEFTKTKYDWNSVENCDYSGIKVKINSTPAGKCLTIHAVPDLVNPTASYEYTAVIEWYYSKSALKQNQIPEVIHQIKILAMNEEDEACLEKFIETSVSIVYPEAIRAPNERHDSNAEYDFLINALKLIDKSINKQMLQIYETLTDKGNRKGRIEWKYIPNLNATSYTSAINNIFKEIRNKYLNYQIQNDELQKLIILGKGIIHSRQQDYNKYKTRSANFNIHSHQFTINFWIENVKMLEELLTVGRSNLMLTEMDDLVVGIKITEYKENLAFVDRISDLIGKLIVPLFLAVVFLWFWNKR